MFLLVFWFLKLLLKEINLLLEKCYLDIRAFLLNVCWWLIKIEWDKENLKFWIYLNATLLLCWIFLNNILLSERKFINLTKLIRALLKQWRLPTCFLWLLWCFFGLFRWAISRKKELYCFGRQSFRLGALSFHLIFCE